MKFALFAALLLSACSILSVGVAEGIQAHDLGGDWRSEGGARMMIGCSGSFTGTAYELNQAPNSGQMPSAAHIASVDEQGFTVSHWPLSSERYTVEQWPDGSQKGARMIAGGVHWIRNTDSDCH